MQFEVFAPPQTQTLITMNSTAGFLVMTNGNNVCQLGSTDNPPVIIVPKDTAMNCHKIRNLPAPTDSTEAATKSYVDVSIKKCYAGYVPRLSK